MEISLAIIGTAGRKEDGRKLSKPHFDAMCAIASELIVQLGENNYPITHLVSGGAAWADHVAVRLFLDHKVKHLRIFMPCEWDNGSFKDTHIPQNAGETANYYHKQFHNATRINSLSEIQSAKTEGAELIAVNRGFYARNALVAKSDCLLAMTFGNKSEVKDGGTAHTVKCYLERVRKEGIYDKSFHYDLSEGMVYQGCTIAESVAEDDEKRKLYNKFKHLHPTLKAARKAINAIAP